MSHYILIISLLIFISCSAPTPAKPLKSTYWSLVELKADKTSRIKHQPSPHLFFHINDSSLHGNDGCNTLQARYTKTPTTFSFSNITSSKISCEEGEEQAMELLKALKDTNHLLIRGNEMFLYHNEEQISRFEAKEDY